MAVPSEITERLKSVNDASGKASAQWIWFWSVMAYLAISIESTTHVQLLLEAPVRLLLGNVDLPLSTFYKIAPLAFLVLHLYVLVQVYMFSDMLRDFDDEFQRAQLSQGGSQAYPKPARQVCTNSADD